MVSQINDEKFLLRHIVMNIQGNVNGCVISKVIVKTLNESFELKGEITWNDIINWNSVLTLHKINIFQKFFKYPISLSGIVAIKGCLYADKWAITISDLNIHGYVRNNRILCTGKLNRNISGKWAIPLLLIKWGFNILTIKGELFKHYVFDLILKAPKCNAVIPKLSGSIYGCFKLCGSIKYLVLFSKIDMHFLRWSNKNLFINRLILTVKFIVIVIYQVDFLLK